MSAEIAHPSKAQALAALLPRLMGLARQAESLANRFKTSVLVGAGSGFLAAAWLSYFCVLTWQVSYGAAAGLGLLLLVPTLVAGWCWSVLDEASTLPQRILAWINSAHLCAGDTRQRLQEARNTPAQSRFKDLWLLGGLLFELKSIGEEARGLLRLLKGTLALGSPLFLLALIGSGLAIGLLDLLALLTGLASLPR